MNKALKGVPGEAVRDTSDSEKLQSLISALGSKDENTCRNAYQSLVAIGEPAVQFLVEALTSNNEKVRWEASRLLYEIKVDWTPYANDKTIDALISDLNSRNGFERIRARQSLVRIGSKTVGGLIQALSSKEDLKRWEAAKALTKIGDSSATEALIKALIDNNFDIRWLAAEGLISIGEPALEPLLHELIKNPDSERLREGAHHVFHDLNNEKLKALLGPVLHALDDIEAHMEVPLAAESALNSLPKR